MREIFDDEEASQATLLHMRYLLLKWERKFGLDESAYTSFLMNDLKAVAAGNAAGLFAIVTYMRTSVNITGLELVFAKGCLLLFFVGLVAAGLSYWYLRNWTIDMDRALVNRANGKEFGDSLLEANVARARKRFWKAGKFGLLSTTSLAVGAVVTFLGLMIVL